MKTLSIVFSVVLCSVVMAQPKKVTESVEVTGQSRVVLDFDFADKIDFKVWDKNEVVVEVMVEINNGEHNDIFTLTSSKTGSTIFFEMDEELWSKIPRDEDRKWNCNYSSRMDYLVYLPSELYVSASTITGDYTFEYFDQALKLKTISGAIDITVPSSAGFDFKAKTISGEVYSDIDIRYPEGKEGLRKIVGQDFKGRINGGGNLSHLETISGNIYLRKG